MPLYEFECDSCGVFEAWRTIAQRDQAPACPTCAAETQRVFSVPNFNLNVGSAFLKAKETKEPQLVKRDLEPKQPPPQVHRGGRPWMLGH
jgi:putative FmdB family regulatory protein